MFILLAAASVERRGREGRDVASLHLPGNGHGTTYTHHGQVKRMGVGRQAGIRNLGRTYVNIPRGNCFVAADMVNLLLCVQWWLLFTMCNHYRQ